MPSFQQGRLKAGNAQGTSRTDSNVTVPPFQAPCVQAGHGLTISLVCLASPVLCHGPEGEAGRGAGWCRLHAAHLCFFVETLAPWSVRRAEPRHLLPQQSPFNSPDRDASAAV